jgi:2-oxoglutarate ferredoxin oxidoreductase subunit gamma
METVGRNHLVLTNDKIEMRFSGFGGQGVVLASMIYGNALAKEGFNVIQTQAYGIEARGGSSSGEVIYSKDSINYLHATAPDMLLALSQEACDKYVNDVRPGAIVICDSFYIEVLPARTDIKLYAAPLTEIAINQMGKEMFTNTLSLGFINGIMNNVKPDNLMTALVDQVGNKSMEENRKALAIGYQKAQEIINKQ